MAINSPVDQDKPPDPSQNTDQIHPHLIDDPQKQNPTPNADKKNRGILTTATDNQITVSASKNHISAPNHTIPSRPINSSSQITSTHKNSDDSTVPLETNGVGLSSGEPADRHKGGSAIPVISVNPTHHHKHTISPLPKVSTNFDKPSYSTQKFKGSVKSAIPQTVRYNAQVNTQANPQPVNTNDHHKVNPPLPPVVKPSFATTLKSIHEHTTPRIEISPAKQTTKQGYPAIIFKRDDYLVKLAERCKFTLVGKFESTMPRMEVIRRSFEAQVQLTGAVKITHFDANHVYIDLTNQLDHDTVWFKQNIWIQGRAMKLFTWTPTFRPSQETPIAPIWVVLPELPWHLYYMEVVSELFTSVGRAICLDTATFQKTRGSVAKVKLEIDVTKSRPNYIWVGFDEDENGEGYWQEVEYQEVPEYCIHCKHQGHSISVCSIKRREDDMANKNDKDKSGSTGPIKNAVLKPPTQKSQLQIQQSDPTKQRTNQSTIDNVNIQDSNAQQGDTTQKKLTVRGRVHKQQYVAKPVSLVPEKATSCDQIGGKSVDQIGVFSDLAMNQIREKSVDLVCTNAFDFLADWEHEKHSSSTHKIPGNLLAATASASQDSPGKAPGMTASKQQIESTKSWVERSFGKTEAPHIDNDRVAPPVDEADNDTVLAQVLSDNEDAAITQNQANTIKQPVNAVVVAQHSDKPQMILRRTAGAVNKEGLHRFCTDQRLEISANCTTPAADVPMTTLVPTDTISKFQQPTAVSVEPVRQQGERKNAKSGLLERDTTGNVRLGQPDTEIIVDKTKNDATQKKKSGKKSNKKFATAEGNNSVQIQTEEDVRKAKIRAWQDAILEKSFAQFPPTGDSFEGCMENKIAYSVPSQSNNLEQTESEAEKSVSDHSSKKETEQHQLAVCVSPAHSGNTLTPTSKLEVICKRASKLMRETGRGFFPVTTNDQTDNEGYEPEILFLGDLFEDSLNAKITTSKIEKSKWNPNAPLFIPKALRQQQNRVYTESVDSQDDPELEFPTGPSDDVLLQRLDLHDIRGLLRRQNSPPQDLPQKFLSPHPGIIEDGSEYEEEDEESTAYNDMAEARYAGLSPRVEQARKPKLIKKKRRPLEVPKKKEAAPKKPKRVQPTRSSKSRSSRRK